MEVRLEGSVRPVGDRYLVSGRTSCEGRLACVRCLQPVDWSTSSTFDLELALIATAPSVEYRLTRTDGTTDVVDNPADMPEAQKIASIEEPFFRLSIISPTEYPGPLMELCQSRRGEMKKMDYLSPERVELVYEVPLAEVVIDFFDQMKSRTKGYASLDYELSGYRPSNLVKVDLLLNGQPADAFSTIVHRDNAEAYGRRMCEKLKELDLLDAKEARIALTGPSFLSPSFYAVAVALIAASVIGEEKSLSMWNPAPISTSAAGARFEVTEAGCRISPSLCERREVA